MTMSDDRRWWREEADHVPKNLTEAIALQQRLVDEAGATPATAAGVVMWLLTKAYGDEDTTAAPTRSRYRKLLAMLDDGDDGDAIGVPKGGAPRGPSGGRPRGPRTPRDLVSYRSGVAA